MTQKPLSVRVSRPFRAPPERVFDAWIEPEKIRAWMLGPAPGEGVRFDVDGRKGGKFSFVVRRQGQEIDHVGEYLEFDRPRRLVFTWMVPAFSNDVTTVHLDFAPEGTGTTLTLEHQGVLPGYEERTAKGWTSILGAVAGSLGE